MTRSDLLGWFSRYRPFVAVIAGVLVVALVLPMRDRGEPTSTFAAGGPAAASGAGSSLRDAADGTASSTRSGPAGPSGAATPGNEASSDGSGGSVAQPGTPTAADPGATAIQPTGVVENCDPNTGRIKVPTVYAPPCVETYSGNTGPDWPQGVTADTIKVAVYTPQFAGGAVAAYIAAGGDPNSIDPETQREVYDGYREMFSHHYETYGREVEFVYVEASGGNQDAQAAKADAIRVAETHKAFASLFGPKGAIQYAQELAARGVMCFDCVQGLPIEFFHAHAPYIWCTCPGWSVGALHVGEIIGKALWGRPAKWAGDLGLQTQTRKFANVYYETPEKAYKAGSDLLDKVLAQYGAEMADHIPYPFDLSTAQSQARTIIARLKAKGITSVLMATDWAYPVFFTQEATQQDYWPEWFSSGASVTNLFGRSYDQQQWANAYSANIAPIAEELTDPYRLWNWHFGDEPPAPCCYWNTWMFFTGVHMAGPTLTPETFRDGMFAYPPSGGRASGQVATMQISFGGHGGFGFDDYTGIDDLDLAWWDPAAVGRDEAGNAGTGMWRHLDGGRHYLPGEYPTQEPAFFDPTGTITQHETWPEGESPPDYPPPSRS